MQNKCKVKINAKVKCEMLKLLLLMKRYTLFRMLILTFLFFCIQGHFNPLKSQEQKKFLMGRVVSESSSVPVANAHIINLMSARGTHTSADGSFVILVAAEDRLLFQSIGFANDTLYISSEIFAEGYVMVELAERIYELPQVDVFPYPTFTDFKFAFLNRQVPDDTYELRLPELPNLTQPGEGFGVRIDGPITALYNQFSRRGRELREYQNVLVREDLRRRASRIVNVEIVRRYTSLEDEAEIHEFLRFCNMTDEYILSAGEVKVYEQLLACYRQYLEVISN
jgi:hypothetical protein